MVIPFNISCGHCFMCEHGLQSQCETTQVREYGTGAALLGYTKLYGQVPGGQAEYLRVPQAQFGPIKVPEGPPDDRFVYLSDVLPTAWQAVEYADVPAGGSRARARPRADRGDGVPHRPAPGRGAGHRRSTSCRSGSSGRARHGVEAIDLEDHDDIAEVVREHDRRPGPGRGDRRGRAWRRTARRSAKLAQRLGGLPAGRRGAARRSRRPASTG